MSISRWLDELASPAPAPGGGGACALHTAIAACLVEMVVNLTIGRPAYAEHETTMLAVRKRTAELRIEALRLVDEDAAAFGAVATAYKLPKESESERTERAARIEEALVGAADVPRRTAEAAGEILDLAETALPGANPNLLADLAAAASSARAGLEIALVNIEVNRHALHSKEHREVLGAVMGTIEADIKKADRLVAAVRDRIDA
jgi:methenyltetrahydrofolate cyclohydrolase